ncbi:MAG: nodulation protein NfeD [Lentisphaeria bacterium]|nr:nodulation protein NfeD [Lentisphaeria bacterium]
MKQAVSLLAVVAFLTATACAQTKDPAADQTKKDDAPVQVQKGSSKTVYVFPIKGAIGKTTLYMFRRAYKDVKRSNPAALIIEMDTPGGRLLETQEIIRLIRSIKKKGVPVYTFVNPSAYSAGALIGLGTQRIYMVPSAHIGDAMPILMPMMGGTPQELPPALKEKMMSPVRAMARGLAQENGYNEELAVSMVDPEAEFKIGDKVICAEGKLLTLTGKEAAAIYAPMTTPLLATKLVDDLDGVLADVDLAGADIIRFKQTSSEKLAGWLTLIGPILLGLALLMGFIEFKTPGFGVPGTASVVFFFLFFFGHYVAGLAGGFELLLFLTGVVLLLLEIFVIPGFGLPGICGILCIVAGATLSMLPSLPKVPPLPGVDGAALFISLSEKALTGIAIAMAVTGVGTWILSKILPKTSIYQGLVLDSQLTTDQGYVAGNVERNRSFLDQVGRALTPLRPAGTAVFGDERLDVVTSGDLIAKGSRIRVIQVEGSRVVVEQEEDDA